MTNELYHVGMPGRSGRYPWGSGDRPYQRLEGKKQKKSSGLFKKKKKLSPEEKAKAEAEAKARKAANKENVLRSGSAREVLQYKGELTNNELQTVINRINLERQLSTLAASEHKSNMDKIDKAMQTLKSVNEWGKIGTDTYNLLANFYNATEEGKKNPWPTISKGGGGGKKKKR